MSHNDDFIAQLEDYFEAFDGATPLPDRVRDAIRAELPSARQVRPRPGLLRNFTMLSNTSAAARLGVATVAVVVAVALGAALLSNRGAGPGVGPSSPPPTSTVAPSLTAAPSASESAAASAVAEPLRLKAAPIAPCDDTDTTPDTCVAPGIYQLNDWSGAATWPVRVTLDVPAGWFDWDAGPGADAVLVDGGPEARGNSGWGVLFVTVGDVSRDPCDATKGIFAAAQVDTPQKLAAAMAGWPRFQATAAESITVAGEPGVKFKLTSTAASSCAASAKLWSTRDGWRLDAYPMIVSGTEPRPAATFEIVDTGHGLLVIRTSDFPETSPNERSGGVAANPTRHAADQVELHAILDSIRFTTLPG